MSARDERPLYRLTRHFFDGFFDLAFLPDGGAVPFAGSSSACWHFC